MHEGVVTRIAELARQGQEIDQVVGRVGGHDMSTVALHHIPPKPEPEPAALRCASLTALAEYVRANRDEVRLETCVFHVASPTVVLLLGPLTGERLQRFTYAHAECTDLGRGFLGSYHDQETFVVALQSRFTPDGDRVVVLEIVGKLRDEQAIESEDDGVTQHVTAKAGVHVSRQIPLPNPVVLAPYRTFREVEQPASAMVLRVQKGPRIGLHEADGGAWTLEATRLVAEWLASQDLHLPILR
jgi:hypothetical protein